MVLFLCAPQVACDTGSVGDDDDDDGSAADAMSMQPDNALGTSCTMGGDECPSDPPHQCVFLDSGSPDVGYCSPVCTTDDDCLDGYTGPSTGGLTCFVPDVPNACSITCDTTADCPEDLVCVITGGPVNVCATPT